ncbi:ionotropic receptor 25a-like, partial [Oppia nitens]|uniref:ionotropic receptor 25a-like n=1 Tax=Oppia nitens TaxID=1686743 RepID=UPI0023DCAAC1
MTWDSSNSCFLQQNPPYMSIELDSDKWQITGGTEFNLLTTFSKHLNFTYTAINCNNEWGTQLTDNQSWNGIIGELQSKRADLGMSEVSMSSERTQVVNFSYPFSVTSMTFMTSLPKTKTNFELVFNVFDAWIWISILGSLFLILLFIRLLSREKPEMRKIHLSWNCISTLFKQPMIHYLPPFLSLRNVFFFWILSSFVLTSSYSQCLYSLMAIPLKEQTIETIEELAVALKSRKIRVQTERSSDALQSFKNSEFSLYKEIAEYIEVILNDEKLIQTVIESQESVA